MPIQQSKKQSDLEKRLKILRQQVYGKSTGGVNIPLHQYTNSQAHPAANSKTSSDISYLYQDLRKILILTSAALGVQISLFLLLKNHLISLNF